MTRVGPVLDFMIQEGRQTSGRLEPKKKHSDGEQRGPRNVGEAPKLIWGLSKGRQGGVLVGTEA